MARFLWLLLPLVPAAASFHFLGADAPAYLIWWLGLSILGIVFLPLSSRLFKGTVDSGWTFAKPLSLAVLSLAMWILSMIHVLPFRQASLIGLACAAALLLYVPKKGYAKFLEAFSTRDRVRAIAFQEFLFGAGLLVWTYARGLKPVIEGLEKFMDFGFMNSMMRTDWLPAKDMWLAGSNINYYYYGQYVYTLVTKFTGIPTSVSYNLALAGTFAFTLALAYAVVRTALAKAREKIPTIPKSAPAFGGLVAALLTTVGGNSHAFFYAYDLPGGAILKWLSTLGVRVGSFGQANFWFANSTRYIGYNPSTDAAGNALHDMTIHEFPFYSFLVADLHAHVIDLMFVLLFLGLLVMLVSQPAAREAARRFSEVQLQAPEKSPDKDWFRRESRASRALLGDTLKNPLFLIPAALLGIFMMTNFWDFAIYFVVACMALLFVNTRGYGATFTLESLPVFALQGLLLLIPFIFVSNPVLAVLCFVVVLAVNTLLTMMVGDALTITGAQMSALFLVAHLVALPFNLTFEPISKSLALAINHTPLFQLLILWGGHFALGLVFVVYCLRRRAKDKAGVDPDAAASRTPFARFLNGFNATDLFVCGLFVCAVGLVLAPEIIYVVDIYSGDYKRANTMFKFTYQAFVLFSLVVGYAIARFPVKRSRNKLDNRWSIAPVVFVLALVIPFSYTIVSSEQWLGNEFRTSTGTGYYSLESFGIKYYKGLDGVTVEKDNSLNTGSKPAAGKFTPYLEAISWFNENVKGQPAILEAYGDSYTDFCVVSAYTGLPTIIGWQTHEWLWRTSKATPNGYSDVVVPHHADVDAIYNDTDAAVAKVLLKKYKVEYIVVGGLERSQFSAIDEAGLQALGSKAFTSTDGTVYVIHVDTALLG